VLAALHAQQRQERLAEATSRHRATLATPTVSPTPSSEWMPVMTLSTPYLPLVTLLFDRRVQAVGALALSLIAMLLLGADGAEAGKANRLIIGGGSGS
jgi:hypothetical protein